MSAGTRRVVVLGAGSAGEHFVGALRRLDDEVEIAVVEHGLAGGECSYYACLPTKTLLRPGEALAGAQHAPGAAEAVTGVLDRGQVWGWRDFVTDGRDDGYHVGWLAEQRAELVRGEARVVSEGVVSAGERELQYDELVIATGSSPATPAIDGLDEVPFWTSRDAVWADAVPASLVVLGGGPVGAELAQFFSRMGATVTIVETNERLLSKVDPEAGELLQERFASEGIEVRAGRRVTAVSGDDSGVRVELGSGEAIDADRVLVATGRVPNLDGLGLDTLDIEVTRRGVTVDDRLRAGEGVWAIGDVAGIGLLTHLGKYQARVVASNIAGIDRVADYRAIPAAVFTDPQVASVGTTEGDGVVTASFTIDGGRLSTYERPRRPGLVKLAADPSRRVLVGAVAVGPEAGEWLGQLTLAVRAETPIDVLVDTIQPYPTFSESIFAALLELETALEG